MRIKRTIIALLVIIALFPTINHAQTPIYNALNPEEALVVKGGFSDIAKTPSKNNILKLRAINIILGDVGSKYYPNMLLSRQDAAICIIRLMDLEDEAVEKGIAMKKAGTSPNYIADSYAIGYLEKLIEKGILTNKEVEEMGKLTKAEENAIEAQVIAEAKREWMTIAKRDELRQQKLAAAIKQKKNMKAYMRRQDLAQWLSRALELEQASHKTLNAIYRYDDYIKIKPENFSAVENLLQRNILFGETKNIYRPEGSIKRSEAADIFFKAIENTPEIQEIKTGVAKVMNISKMYEADKSGTQKIDAFIMQNFDGNEFYITTQGNTIFPIIKDGEVYHHSILEKGDSIEYAIRDDKILYGVLESYQLSQDQENTSRALTANHQSEGEENITAVLAENDQYREDLILQKGSDLSPSDIRESIEYYAEPEYIEGIIKYIDISGKIIKFEDYDGNMRTYQLDDRVEVLINNYLERLDYLNTGHDATFEIVGKEVKSIKAFASPGQETIKEFIAVLRVREVNGDNIKVSAITDRDNSKTYKTDRFTSITYFGSPIKTHNLKIGDLVKIKSKEDEKDRAESVELVTKRQRVEKVYKADILNTLPLVRSLAVSNVRTYTYPDWRKINNELVFPVKPDAEIYRDGVKIQLNDLDKLRGLEAYIATTNDFGQESIAKVNLKSVSEDSVFSGYFDTEWTASTIRLDDGQKLAFDDGTIIIKDRRLLDSTDLTYNDEAFIIKNKLPGGTNYAALMTLENVNGFDYRNVTRGFIHDMGEDYFSIESIAHLVNNQWDYYYDEEEYYYVSKDTRILDNVVKDGYITRDHFLESRYWEKNKTYDRNAYTIHDPSLYMDEKGPHYEKCRYKSQHMLAYVYKNEDGEAVGVNIYKRSGDLGKKEDKMVFTENLKTGEVMSTNPVFSQLRLANVREFSYFYDRWQPSSSSDVINLENAIIIKNERIISQEDLFIGDSIYAITDQNKGIMIFVE